MLDGGFQIEQRFSAWQKKNVRTIIVNCRSHVPQQRSIVGALHVAKPYDRLELVGGDYAESVTVSLPIELVASDGEEARLIGRGSCLTITNDVDVFCSDLDIVTKGRGKVEAGVAAMAGTLTMFRCKVNSILAGGTALLSLERCVIRMSYSGVGLRFSDRAGGDVTNCSINTHSVACVEVDTTGELLIKKCTLSQPSGLGSVVVVSGSVSSKSILLPPPVVPGGRGDRRESVQLFDLSGGPLKSLATARYSAACQQVRFEENMIFVGVSSSAIPDAAWLREMTMSGNAALMTSVEGVASCVVVTSSARPTFVRNDLTEGDIGFLFEASGSAKLEGNAIRGQKMCGLLALVEDASRHSTRSGTLSPKWSPEGGGGVRGLSISGDNLFEHCRVGIAVQRTGERLDHILTTRMTPLLSNPLLAASRSQEQPALGGGFGWLPGDGSGNGFSWLPHIGRPSTNGEGLDDDVETLLVPLYGERVSASALEVALRQLVQTAALASLASLESISASHYLTNQGPSYLPSSATTASSLPSASASPPVGITAFLKESLGLVIPAPSKTRGDSDVSGRPGTEGDAMISAAKEEMLKIRGSGGVDVVGTRFSNCQHCALLFGIGGYGLVDSCFFDNCGGASIIVDSGAHPMIMGCQFFRTDGRNILFGNFADPFIFGNVMSHCRATGIEVHQLGYGIIAGNIIVGNDNAGIMVRDNSTTIVYANHIRDNTGGVVVDASGKPLIVRNTLVGNAQGQVRSANFSCPFLWHNALHVGLDVGLLFTSCSIGIAISNVISSHVQHGVVTELDADPIVSKNEICRNQQCGIVVRDNGVGTFVGNVLVANSSCNVQLLEGASATFRRNTLREAGVTGVCVAEEGAGLLEYNAIVENTVANVIVANVHSDPVLRKNTISAATAGVGVLVCMDGGGTFVDNVIQGNKVCGIFVTTYGNPTVKRNVVTKEAVGVLVGSRGKGIFSQNTITANHGCGVIIQRQGDPTFTENVVSHSQTIGLLVGPDGRGEFCDNKLYANDVGIQLGSTIGTGEVDIQTPFARTDEALLREIEKGSHTRREAPHKPKGSAPGRPGGSKFAGGGLSASKYPPVRAEAVISSNEVYENLYTGLLIESHANGRVERNRIHHNSHYGIVGDVLYGTRRTLLSMKQKRVYSAIPEFHNSGGGSAVLLKNEVHSHMTANIAVMDIPASDVRIEESVIHTAPVGVFIGNRSNAPAFTLNRIHHCADGVFVESGGAGNFVQNTIEDCSGVGVYCSTQGNPLFSDGNTIQRCRFAGVLVDAYGAGVFRNCRITACGIGVVVHSGPCVVPSSNRHENLLIGDDVFASTEFSDNDIVNNEFHGILALSSPSGSSIRSAVLLPRREPTPYMDTPPPDTLTPPAAEEPAQPSTVGPFTSLAQWSEPGKPVGDRHYPLFKGNRISRNRFFGVFHEMLPSHTQSEVSQGRVDGANAVLRRKGEPTPFNTKQRAGNALSPIHGESRAAGCSESSTRLTAAAAATATVHGSRLSLGSSIVECNSVNQPASASLPRESTSGLPTPLSLLSSDGEGRPQRLPFTPHGTLNRFVCFVENEVSDCTIGVCVGSLCRPYLHGNRIFKNLFFGMLLRWRSQPLARFCEISGSGIAGVYATYGALGIIEDGVIKDNNGFTRDPETPSAARSFHGIAAATTFLGDSSGNVPEFLRLHCDESLVRNNEQLSYILETHRTLLDDTAALLGELVAVSSDAPSLAPHSLPSTLLMKPVNSDAGAAPALGGLAVKGLNKVCVANGGIGVWLGERSATEINGNLIEDNRQVGVLYSREAKQHHRITRDFLPDVHAVHRALTCTGPPAPSGNTTSARRPPATSGKTAAPTAPSGGLLATLTGPAQGYLFMPKPLAAVVPRPASVMAEAVKYAFTSLMGVSMDDPNDCSIIQDTLARGTLGPSHSPHKAAAGDAVNTHNSHAMATVVGNRISANGTGVCIQLFNSVTANPVASSAVGKTAPVTARSPASGAGTDGKANKERSAAAVLAKGDAVVLPTRWSRCGPKQRDGLAGDASPLSCSAELSGSSSGRERFLTAAYSMPDVELSALHFVLTLSGNIIFGNHTNGIFCEHIVEIHMGDIVATRMQLHGIFDAQLERMSLESQESSATLSGGDEPMFELLARPKHSKHAKIDGNDLRGNHKAQVEITARFIAIPDDRTRVLVQMDTMALPDHSLFSSLHLTRVPIVAALVQSSPPGMFLIQRNSVRDSAIGVRLHGPVGEHCTRLRMNHFRSLSDTAIAVDGHLSCTTVGEANEFDDNHCAIRLALRTSEKKRDNPLRHADAPPVQFATSSLSKSATEMGRVSSSVTRVFQNYFRLAKVASIMVEGDRGVCRLQAMYNIFTAHREGAVAVLVRGAAASTRIWRNVFCRNYLPLLITDKAGLRGEVVVERNRFTSNFIGALLSGGCAPQLNRNMFERNVLCGVELVGKDTQPTLLSCVFQMHHSGASASSPVSGAPFLFPCGNSFVVKVSSAAEDTPSITVPLASPNQYRRVVYSDSDEKERPQVIAVTPKNEPVQGLSPHSSLVQSEAAAKQQGSAKKLAACLPAGVVVGPGAGGTCENCIFQDNDIGVDVLRDGVLSLTSAASSSTFTLRASVLRRQRSVGLLVRGTPTRMSTLLSPLPDHTTLEQSALISNCVFTENYCSNEGCGDVVTVDNGFAVVQDCILSGITHAHRDGIALFQRNKFTDFGNPGGSGSGSGLFTKSRMAIILHEGNRSRFTDNTIRDKRLGVLSKSGTWGRCEGNLFLSTSIAIECAPLSNGAFVRNRIVASRDCGVVAYGGIFSANEISGCPVGGIIHYSSAHKQFASLSASVSSASAYQVVFSDNVVHSCDTDGILVAGGGKISGNRVFNCKTGIRLVCQAPVYEKDSLPILTRNTCYDAEMGIVLGVESVGTVSEHEIFDNSVLGMLVLAGSSCVIEHNHISSALDRGALEIVPEARVKNNQNTVRNQFSPAYNKGLQNIRVRERQREASELAAEMEGVNAKMTAALAQQADLVTQLARLANALVEESLDENSVSLLQPDELHLAGPASRALRRQRNTGLPGELVEFGSMSPTLTDLPFDVSTFSPMSRIESPARWGDRKRHNVSFMLGLPATGTSISALGNSEGSGVNSSTKSRLPASVNNVVQRRNSRSGSVTQYGRQKRTSQSAHDVKKIVQRQQRRSLLEANEDCVHDVLIHVVAIPVRDAHTEATAVASDGGVDKLKGDARSSRAGEAKGALDASKYVVALERCGQQVASVFSGPQWSLPPGSEREMKFSTVVTTNAADLASYMASTVPSVSVVVGYAPDGEVSAADDGAAPSKDADVSAISPDDALGLFRLCQHRSNKRPRRSLVRTAVNLLHLSFVMLPDFIKVSRPLGRKRSSVKGAGNKNAALKRKGSSVVGVQHKVSTAGLGAATRASQASNSAAPSTTSLSLEEYAASCTGIIYFHREPQESASCLAESIREEIGEGSPTTNKATTGS